MYGQREGDEAVPAEPRVALGHRDELAARHDHLDVGVLQAGAVDALRQDALQLLRRVGAGQPRARARAQEAGDVVVEPEEAPLPDRDGVVHRVAAREPEVEERDPRLVSRRVLAVDERYTVCHAASLGRRPRAGRSPRGAPVIWVGSIRPRPRYGLRRRGVKARAVRHARRELALDGLRPTTRAGAAAVPTLWPATWRARARVRAPPTFLSPGPPATLTGPRGTRTLRSERFRRARCGRRRQRGRGLHRGGGHDPGRAAGGLAARPHGGGRPGRSRGRRPGAARRPRRLGHEPRGVRRRGQLRLPRGDLPRPRAGAEPPRRDGDLVGRRRPVRGVRGGGGRSSSAPSSSSAGRR